MCSTGFLEVIENPSMKLWTRVVSCRNAAWEMAPDVDGIVLAGGSRSVRPTMQLPGVTTDGRREWCSMAQQQAELRG